ncbi:acyloxyacyl hydrolase [Flavobacterium aciduliphilum]|uniref:Lipid A 3-O-deacylase PagL n=1 Tax=Flavobacterium aciduliphilum TaxID=1101402 RepID=A0A328YLF9_9FLAO|nr:acyloxyacyl hydrolase [Flavobacterium aciduliphilum]RAR74154.1 lipid A 3-O-deacylase PagL [Flavobacterium aciduliphilum]
MKKWFLGLFLCSSVLWSQNNQDTNAIEVSLFRGNVLPHTTDLYHLQGHPDGMMVNFLKQTHGKEAWHSVYNFPDYGVYFQYQNYNNEFLGKVYALGALYNFYFLNRHLELKIAQGIGYATNPYDKVENSKNKAFGSTLMANTNIGLFFKKDNIYNHFGVYAGFLFTHFSNGRTKSPNSGINTFLLNLGLQYNFSEATKNVRDLVANQKIVEPIRYNFVFRSGYNESQIIGSGQYPFYHIGFFVDKRFSRKSALQVGTELFLTQSFKDYIKYKANAYPELNIDPNIDYKRVGAFVGYELFVNKISLEAQVGYYIYRPFVNDISVYDRIGFKYHFKKKLFASFSVKTHMFLAEALEYGLGIRL